MSRFHHLNRIESAIKRRDRRELAWAQEYARFRLTTALPTNGALRKAHQTTWRILLERVEATLADLSAPPIPSA